MRFVKGHHGIFVPEYTDIILPKSLRVGVEGHIGVELIDARTKKVKRRLKFKNLVTNAGLNAMATTAIEGSTSLTKSCAVGTGTTAPTNADTTLEAELASGSRVQFTGSPGPTISYVAGTPDYYKCLIEYLYDESSANGNLTEVGFFTSTTTGGTMFSRQLFKDELGDPTEVTKTSDDQLKITYELRCYPPVDDVVLSDQDISGTTVDVTARAIAVGSTRWNTFFTSWASFAAGGSNNRLYSSALVSRTSTSFGTTTGSNVPTNTAAAYVTDNFYRDVTVKQEPSAGASSILSYMFSGGLQIIFGIGFSSAIAKADTERFTLNYRTSWARHT